MYKSQTFKFQFKAKPGETVYDIWYQFSIKKCSDTLHSEDELENGRPKDKVQVFNEVLSFGGTSEGYKVRKSVLIDTRTQEVFTPKLKYKELLGEEGQDITELLVTKRLAQEQSRSFIFCKGMIERYRRNCQVLSYKNAFRACSDLHNMQFALIRKHHIQMAINDSDKTYSGRAVSYTHLKLPTKLEV